MKIGGHPASEVIGAIFIILWAVIKFAAIVMLIIGVAWLAYSAFVLVLFFIVLGLFAKYKIKR